MYAIHHTILVLAILCKGQPGPAPTAGAEGADLEQSSAGRLLAQRAKNKRRRAAAKGGKGPPGKQPFWQDGKLGGGEEIAGGGGASYTGGVGSRHDGGNTGGGGASYTGGGGSRPDGGDTGGGDVALCLSAWRGKLADGAPLVWASCTGGGTRKVRRVKGALCA